MHVVRPIVVKRLGPDEETVRGTDVDDGRIWPKCL